MSKIGKAPVKLPEGVKAEIKEGQITITGPKGTVSKSFPKTISIEEKDGSLIVALVGGETKEKKALWGTTRAIAANMVLGVTVGWKKELELVGAGFKAEVSGNVLSLTVGYSHPVKITAPEGITFSVEKLIVKVEGADKELVGQVAANIRGARPPEPYKGKGIKYVDEVIKRKPGKAAAKAIGAPAG